MSPERFRRIEELYHAAREGTPDERAALLAQTDPELRREVESLLSESSGDEMFDRPAIRNAPELLEDATVTRLHSGACLGPYRIESKLGEGGMGEVFRAVDMRLGRAVAIKTTHERFSARFEREARAIASLNHPNICTLHDVGPNYLVMELVEGETLAARLKHGPLAINTALLYALQIAAALVEAHAKGIVHRDLKPGNIMVGRSGVKVLDFGLARSCQDETITASRMIVGTPAYMAPEQREGKSSDARMDIYAFGCVLYEMLTGARVGPQPRRIRPRKLEKIVGRCLEEDPGRRWQSGEQVQRALAGVLPSRRATYMAAGAAATVALCAAGYVYLNRAPGLTVKGTIVLAEFENRTGDAVFDLALRQGLAVQLQQSPYLSLVPDESIRQTLRLMKRPLETRLTPEVAREVCERSGSAAVLEGSIASLGNQYVLWLRTRSCRTGEALTEGQTQARTKEEVLNALSRIAIQVRMRLGESITTIQQHSRPLEQATTSSLEALKAYSAGQSALYAHGYRAAIPYFKQAVALDPQFAMAHASLGFHSWNMGQTDFGAEEIRKAYELRDRVSDPERFFILMLYDREVTGNLQKELLTLESWAQTYPHDPRAHSIIAGWGTRGTGQYERGIREAQEAIRLAPDLAPPHSGLASHYLLLDRFEESAEALRRAAERNVDFPEFLVTRYYLAFFKGDKPGMDREIAHARGQHVEDEMSHHQALVLARSGKMQQARVMWQRAAASAQQAGLLERAAIFQSAQAVCEAHCGNLSAAKERARAALRLGKGRDVEYAAAFALALSGDSAGSQRLAADLESRFPEDTPVQFEYLPILHALSALARRAPSDAGERLQRALPYDFALPGTGFVGKFGGGYPAYVRGQAYLAAGRGQEAASEFQKILNHRGVVFADPIGALAHLQLGRAYVLSGDMIKAKSAYQDFLTLWRDADPDVPVLKHASAEFAKL
ncbi:MAG TPA: protein kinase [Bryobacteraceae bacterium]|nr:protein kinase [Bryobacteraceae bacterium]